MVDSGIKYYRCVDSRLIEGFLRLVRSFSQLENYLFIIKRSIWRCIRKSNRKRKMKTYKSIAELIEPNKQIKRGFDNHGNPIALTDKEFFDISLFIAGLGIYR